MQYMLLIMGDETRIPATVAETGMSPEFLAYNAALAKAGVLVAGHRLRPASSATTIKVRDKKAVVLAGPYAETQEQLGGYYVIDVPDLDQALAWAERCPAAERGTIEVRPVWPTALQ
jgi:hypothetical protein